MLELSEKSVLAISFKKHLNWNLSDLEFHQKVSFDLVLQNKLKSLKVAQSKNDDGGGIVV